MPRLSLPAALTHGGAAPALAFLAGAALALWGLALLLIVAGLVVSTLLGSTGGPGGGLRLGATLVGAGSLGLGVALVRYGEAKALHGDEPT